MRSSSPSSTLAATLDTTTVHAVAADAARAYGAAHGYTGRNGWIFDASGERLARGWAALARELLAQGAIVLVSPGKPASGYRLAAAAPAPTPAAAPLEIIASDRSWLIHRGARMLVSGPLAGPRRTDDELRELLRQRLREGRIPSLVDERERWAALATEITSDTPVVRAPGLAQDVAPLSCLADPTPAKSSAPAPAEALADAQDPELQDAQGGEAGAELLQDPERATTPAPIASLAEQGTTEIRVWPRTGGGRSWEIYRNGKRTGLGGDLFKPLDNAELRELARRQMDAMPGARWVLQEDIKVKRLGAAPTTTPAAGASAAEQGAQEAIAVKRGGGGPRRRPAKSTTTPAPATETPPPPPLPAVPPVPSKPVKAPPKRPASALPTPQPETVAGSPEQTPEQAPQPSTVEGSPELPEQGGELPELREQEGEGGGLGEPRPEIAGLARTLIRERSGGDGEGEAGGPGASSKSAPAAPSSKSNGRGAAPALSPELEALAAPWRAAAAMITGTPAEQPGGGEAEHAAPLPISRPAPKQPGEAGGVTEQPRIRMPPASSQMSAPRPVAAPRQAAAPLDRRMTPRARRAPSVVRVNEVQRMLPASVADLAKYALSVGKRRGILPARYTLARFIVDAVWERAYLLGHEKGLGIKSGTRLHEQATLAEGEAGEWHALIIDA